MKHYQSTISWYVFTYMCLAGLLLLGTPAIARAGVFNDAYSYLDNFEDASGLNLAESSGVTVSTEGLVTETPSAVAVSQCIALPQPDGGMFQGWSFMELSLADSGGMNSLDIQDCAGSTLKTVTNLTDGNTSIDLSDVSAPAIRLRLTVNQAGVNVDFWKIFGRAEGVTMLEVSPNTVTPNAGDTITFTLNFSSSGAITRNPVLRFSLDTINGLHTPDVDDGLAEDAEVDYGSGVNAYRPLEFVSASNGPNGEISVTPAVGATEGEIVWNLNDLSDGFADNVTVELRIPQGYIKGKTLAAQAALEHGISSGSGGYHNRMSEEETSGIVMVNAVSTPIQTPYTPYSNVGPGATNIYNTYFIRNNLSSVTNRSDLEDITLTITGIGDCTPLFRQMAVHNGSYPYQMVRTPAVGSPITADDPVIVHFDRVRYHNKHYYVKTIYDIPDSCSAGNKIGTQATVIGGNPIWSDTDSIHHNVVLEVCRKGGNYTHQVMSGNNAPAKYYRWPGWPEFYIYSNSSLRMGEYFTTWAPYGNEGYRAHTIPLEHSYNLIEIPPGITFHGVRELNRLDRLYKDCTGSAPSPTDATFDHNAEPPHPNWQPVDMTWSGPPFSNLPNENDPQAIVQSGCRLLSIKDADNPAWQEPDYGNWAPVFLWRVCDGSYGCAEVPDGTAMSLIGGTIFTYETVTEPGGSVHECSSYNGWTLYKEQKSWPKVYAWPEENQVPAGQMAHIIVNPENQNRASQYVDGRWGINFYEIREQVDLLGVTGEVLIDGLNIPNSGQNIAGQRCNIADITFHAPESAGCMSATRADAPACMGWWEIPAACQPPNGWGYKRSEELGHDDYVQMYRFRVNIPVLRTTSAGTVLDFAAEVRINDLASQGADNAVDPVRWSVANYTAITSVTVLELPGLDAAKTGPAARKPGDQFTYRLEVKNLGNTPNNGWYLVDWLPRNGVNGSELTPEYRQVFVELAPDEVIVEFSTDTVCFTDPQGGSWTAMALQPTTRVPYQAETVEDVAPDATCLRIRRHPDATENFNPGDLIRAAFDVIIPNEAVLDGKSLFNRALAGSAISFGASSDLAPVETVNVRTLVSSDVVVKIEKSVEIDPAQAGALTWRLRVYNASGSPAANVDVLDELPPEVSYEGLAAALPAGWMRLQEPVVGDTGGILRIQIDELAPDDGTPGSGADEGLIVFRTRVIDAVLNSLNSPQIVNCASAIPEIGQGDQSCVSTMRSPLDVAKAQDVTDQVPETAIPDVRPGAVFSYLITATNVWDQAVFLGIFDVLDDFVDYVAGTFTVNSATASDSYFSGGLLDYRDDAAGLNPGETLTLAFDVRVKDVVSHGWIIDNTALITAYTGPLDPYSAFATLATNVVGTRVENPGIPVDPVPEPTTLLFFGTGLAGILIAVRRKRQHMK